MDLSFIKAGKKKTKPANKGFLYEQAACRWLAGHGLKLIEANYLCRYGEIDLIMQDKHTLVFFEVRFRDKAHHGSAIESVDWRKQEKIGLTAEHYLSAHPKYQHQAVRIDVLGVYPNQTNAMMCGQKQELVFEWVKNAIMPF